MAQIKQAEIKNAITGAEYTFTLKQLRNAGKTLYAFSIENVYGETLDFTWLLSEESVEKLKELFTTDDHS